MINWEALGDKLDQALNDRKHIVLATHVNADGDGLGSEISLWSFLKERGHEVFMINDDPVPQKYRFLKGSEEILVFDKERCRKLIQSCLKTSMAWRNGRKSYRRFCRKHRATGRRTAAAAIALRHSSAVLARGKAFELPCKRCSMVLAPRATYQENFSIPTSTGTS